MESDYYGYRSRIHDPRFSVRIVADVTEEPITLAQACDQVRQGVGNDDAYITSLIPVARTYVENITGQFLCTRTLAIAWNSFPFPRGEMVLPFGPLTAITSITYRDLSDTLQTVDPTLYRVDVNSVLGSAYLPLFNYWPLQICQSHSVTIQGTFGFGSVASGLIPATLVHLVKIALAHFYENREAVVLGLTAIKMPHSFDALAAQYRTNWI